MKTCDICGKEQRHLNHLAIEYQTDEIKEGCAPCLKETNDHLGKLRKMTTALNTTWTKRFMAELKNKFRAA